MTMTGTKYDRNLSRKEIAALIRNDVKALLPKGAKVSITCSRGSAINVTLTAYPRPVANPAHVAFLRAFPMKPYEFPRYTFEVAKLLAQIEALASEYRRDDSDSMTDYFNCNFYLFVGVAREIEYATDACPEFLADIEVTATFDRAFALRQIETLSEFRTYRDQDNAVRAALAA